MNIPLINTNDKESINTSLIAIKRATEELNNLIKIADEKMAQLDEKAKKYTDDKINALDVASVGGSGKYISAISETDGKISATASDITSTVSSGNSQPVTSGGVFDDSFLLREEQNSDIDNYPIDGIRAYKVTGKPTVGWAGNDGFIINIPWNINYGAQIAVDDQSNWLAIRTKSQGTWGNWSRIIDEELLNKINYSASARNIDTLYPSENGKSEVFGGNFSGNVPEPMGTAILKTFRVSAINTSEVQIYQEWEAYGSSASSYIPNQYFRFGYFTGSASPTWTNWQKVIRASDLGGSALKYKDITFTIADMPFSHVTTSGRDFWYCSIPKSTYFTDNQIIVSTMIVFWNGISPMIAQIDGDGTSLSFQYWDNNFASGANIKVRYLYLET